MLGHQPDGSAYGVWRLIEGCPTVLVSWKTALTASWGAEINAHALGLRTITLDGGEWVTLRSLVRALTTNDPACCEA